MNERLLYVVGPSGAGKDSVLDWAMRHHRPRPGDPALHLARRTVTRVARADAEDHDSLTPEAFEQAHAAGAFVFDWHANGLRYGIARDQLRPLEAGHWVIVNGSRAHLPTARAQRPGLRVVHVSADIDSLRRRLLARGREDAQAVEARVRRALAFHAPEGALEIRNDGALAEAGTRLLRWIDPQTTAPRSSTHPRRCFPMTLDTDPIGIAIRAMAIDDHPALIALLQSTPGTSLRDADSLDATRRYLQRNPGLSFIAIDTATGTLAGCAMSGHDGRRGYLQHVAVTPAFRRQGLAQRLVRHCIDALAREGIMKTHIDVLRTNGDGLAFWQRRGWILREDLHRMSWIEGHPNA